MGPLGNLQNSRDRFSIDPNSQMAPGDTTVEPTPILGALVVVRRFPFGLDPTLLFEPMQRRVQRPGFRLENVARSGADRLANATPLLRRPAQGLRNQHFQRALEQLDPVPAASPLAIDVSVLHPCLWIGQCAK
jgi:hypothetical protein